MTTVIEGPYETRIYPTDDGLLAIQQRSDIVVLLSADELPGVIRELRAYYDTRARWQETPLG